MSVRRRRALLLISVALASGGLAASQVHERERKASEQLGPAVEVLVAARDLRAGASITRGEVALRPVPARFVPRDALASAAGVIGARIAVPVAAGGYLTAGLFEDGEGRGSGVRSGERAVTVQVAGGGAVAGLAPGARVDVLVSSEPGASAGRTQMALAGAELLRLTASPGEAYPGSDAAPNASPEPGALATLRVTLRQAIYLTAADNFAREIRLLARPPGDRSRAGGTVSHGQL